MPQLIPVNDAGLVLTSAYLTHYFQSVGLMENKQFKGESERSKAACLVETLATGIPVTTCRSLTAKLLCGIPESAPTPSAGEPTDIELAIGEKLLRAMLASWPAIGDSGLAGLRETFLLREGHWQPGAESDSLTVPRQSLDVLLDLCPWTFSTIYQPWMPRPLRVTW